MRTERDARLIYGAAFVRSATVSLVGVTLAIHLADLGFTATQIGLLIGVGLAGSSLATVVVSVRGDTWGRRRVLVGLTLLSAMGYVALAAFTSARALVPLALVGMLNGMGRDRGAASALEQAILPETVPDNRSGHWRGTTSCWTVGTRSVPSAPSPLRSSWGHWRSGRRSPINSHTGSAVARCFSASCRILA